jgi:hypothetical protein
MTHLKRYWAKAIILAVVELDFDQVDADDRLYWHEIFKGATS